MRNLVYQIFVDRFAGEGGAALVDPPSNVDPWRTHAGGTLDGISARLDHIQSLGADAIYLTPIFKADSNHKYDTQSFEEIDPRFGGDAAFARLAGECWSRGIGLILDAVFNHVGDRHPWFVEQRPGFFKPGARWRGYGHLPELDLSSRSVETALSEVLRRWTERGATGWRFDCANDLGLAMCERMGRTVRELNAVDGAIGEVMSYAEEWVREGRLDGVMNYWFRETALGLASGLVPAIQAAQNLKVPAKRYRYEALLRSWNVLATHDTPRLATSIEPRRERELALALAFTSPGTPLVYYGEEIGMQGGRDPDNRRVMIWDEARWDHETLSFVRALSSLRRKHRALREGAFTNMPHPGTPELLAFLRTTSDPTETLVIVMNGSAHELAARVFVPYSHLYDAVPLADQLHRAPMVRIEAGRFDVRLQPFQAAIYAPDDTTIPGYRFFGR